MIKLIAILTVMAVCPVSALAGQLHGPAVPQGAAACKEHAMDTAQEKVASNEEASTSGSSKSGRN